MKKILLIFTLLFPMFSHSKGIDDKINDWFKPIADAWVNIVLYPINFSDNFTFEARKYKKSEFSSILESRKSRETSIIFNH